VAVVETIGIGDSFPGLDLMRLALLHPSVTMDGGQEGGVRGVVSRTVEILKAEECKASDVAVPMTGLRLLSNLFKTTGFGVGLCR